MPRGSKPGERRGGRQRGTPNKKTLLRNAAVNAAAADANISPLGFLLGLMRDVCLPIERRVDAAAAALPLFHAKLKAPKRDPNAPRTWTLIDAIDAQPRPGSGGKIKLVAKPKPPAADGAADSTITPLEFLLKVMSDPAAPPDLRVKVARIAAPYTHRRPTTAEPVIDSDTVTTDEYGFIVEQAFAKKLRDLVIKERVSFYEHGKFQKGRGIRDEIDELCKILPDCPSCYGNVQAGADAHRLDEYCIERIVQRESLRLSPEQDAEEAHVVFRLKTYRKAYEKTSDAQARREETLRHVGDGHEYKDPYELEAASTRVKLSLRIYLRESEGV